MTEERARLDTELGQTRMFLELQEKLVAQRLKGQDLSDADRKTYIAATATIDQAWATRLNFS